MQTFPKHNSLGIYIPRQRIGDLRARIFHLPGERPRLIVIISDLARASATKSFDVASRCPPRCMLLLQIQSLDINSIICILHYNTLYYNISYHTKWIYYRSKVPGYLIISDKIDCIITNKSKCNDLFRMMKII